MPGLPLEQEVCTCLPWSAWSLRRQSVESCQLHRASGAHDDNDEEAPLVLLMIIGDHGEVVAPSPGGHDHDR